MAAGVGVGAEGGAREGAGEGAEVEAEVEAEAEAEAEAAVKAGVKADESAGARVVAVGAWDVNMGNETEVGVGVMHVVKGCRSVASIADRKKNLKPQVNIV